MELTPLEERDAVTRHLLDPRWSVSADSSTFPRAITERLIDAHIKCVARSCLEYA